MQDGTTRPPEQISDHAITVLLVDDQMMVGETVRRMLAPEKDIVLHFCQDPTQAIKMATEVAPTVILQDLVMPEVDGLTLVKFFRAHKRLKDVPLIVLSSKEEAVTKAEAFALGANDYLVKLPDRIELIARIRYHSTGYINLLQRNEAYEALFKSRQVLAAQLASAAEYVVSLLPEPIRGGGIITDWRYVPSAQLGGDSLGYHWIDEDISPCTCSTCATTGSARPCFPCPALNVLRSQTLPSTDFRLPDKVLSALNQTFPMEKQNGLYFTLWYGVYNRTARRITYATAGHPAGLLISAADGIAELLTKNIFIGGMPDIVYTNGTIDLAPPARLYIFSDGVFEVADKDGVMWSVADLKAFLREMPPEGASEIDRLYACLRERRGGADLEDDFSMLKIAFLE